MSRQQPQAHRFARLAGTAPSRQAVRIRASPSTKLPILLLLLLALLLFSDSTIGSYDNSRRGSFSSSESGSRGGTPSNSPRHGHAAAAARRRR
ncbi:hypothetical protein DFJ73DRAFT_784326 [Zopfochytrium polystomum]|nr:hypothetical protein DFJ73DRAFT_784326 [Zopfochytrium polystomum]